MVAQRARRSLRHRVRRIIRYATRSSHRELLTRSLRADVAALRGTVVDIGGGRDAPLGESWTPGTNRVRLDISDRFRPDIVADAAALPLQDASVDGAVMCEVLEHLPLPQVAVDEIMRVLRPAGTLLGSVPFAIGVHADPHDYYRYTASALRRLFSDFDDVEIRHHGNHIGVAWRALNERWHVLWVLNPLVRPFVRRPDARWPVGYTFVARKAAAVRS